MPASILIVDDESYIRTLLCRVLEDQGYTCRAAANGEEAWQILQQQEYTLLLSDITMPGLSGLELLGLVRSRFPDLAVLMITGIADRKTGLEALRQGAYGYLIKPLDLDEVAINVANALERRRLAIETRGRWEKLEEAVENRARELRSHQEEIAFRLVWAAERRDPDSADHIRRIGLYSARIAERLGWDRVMVEDIRIAAMMHDVGKIGIPDFILMKTGPLTPEEFEIMKTHTTIGAKILENSSIPLIQMACDIALEHHEKWDGSGYPRGLAGRLIKEGARIVAVADVFDAVGSERRYKGPTPDEDVLQFLESQRSRHFDPAVLDAFFSILPDILDIRTSVRTGL